VTLIAEVTASALVPTCMPERVTFNCSGKEQQMDAIETVTEVETELPAPRIEDLEDEWTALGCGCQTDWPGTEGC
jgi:hypothetical protein